MWCQVVQFVSYFMPGNAYHGEQKVDARATSDEYSATRWEIEETANEWFSPRSRRALSTTAKTFHGAARLKCHRVVEHNRT